MQIRIVKRPPAPIMDGFDVHAFQDVGRVYDVDSRVARYLILAGYATEGSAAAEPARARPKKRRPSKDR